MTSQEGWLHGVNKLEHRETTVHCPLSTRSAPASVQAQGGAAQVSRATPKKVGCDSLGHPPLWLHGLRGTFWKRSARESTRNLRLRIPGVWLLTSQVWRWGQTLGGGRVLLKESLRGERSLPHLLNRPVPNPEA